MKIGVDLQSVGRARTGDETYYKNLVSHYSALRPEDDFFLYYTKPEAEEFFQGLKGRFYPRKLAFQSPFIRVPIAYPLQLRRDPVDVFHSQYVGFTMGQAKLVLTIHDLSYELYPEMFPRNRAFFLRLTRWSARKAEAVVVVSEHTKKDLMRLYGVPEEKIHVVYNAAHPRFSPCRNQDRIEQIKRQFGIRKDFILSVGSLQPRKNILRLVKAYLQARAQKTLDVQLVIAGKMAWGDPEWETWAQNSPYKQDIIFTGYVADDDLPALYSAASMFVYPSLYEGFGLPVLEAMACGTPVITSNRSSLPEVGGQAVAYLNPEDVEDMTRAMVTLYHQPEKQETLRQRGLERSTLFSWKRTAQKTLGVYESVLKNSVVRCLCVLACLMGKWVLADVQSPEQRVLDDSRFGTYIAGGLGLYAPIEVWHSDIQRAKALHMGIIRSNTDTWDLLEPRRGQYHWSHLDSIVRLLNQAHMDFLFTIPISAQWNRPEQASKSEDSDIGPTHFSTADLGSVHDFCKTLASRYKGSITYYEVWNEEDLPFFWAGKPDAEKYFNFIQSAYAGLKEGNPNCVVLIGGLANPANPSWFDQFLALGGGRYFDRANIHVYPALGTLGSGLKTVRGLLQKYHLHKSIWITETSSTGMYFDTADRKKEEYNKALYLVKTYAEALSQPDVERVFWHTLRNPGADVQVRELDFGLMTNAAHPLPAFHAYEVLRDELLHSRPMSQVAQQGIEGYRFDHDRKRVFVLWTDGNSTKAAFPPEYSKGRLIKLLGESQEITPQRFPQISVAGEPVYLEVYR